MYMLITLIFADNIILLNLSLKIFAAPVEVEKALIDLEMMVVMNLVMMVLRIIMMK